MSVMIYILLSQLGIAVLYLLYKLFLSGDTFLRAHRATLLCGIVFAFLYPMAYFSHYALRMENYVATINEQYGIELPTLTVGIEQTTHSWGFVDLYILGVVIGTIFLLVRLGSVLYIFVRSRREVVLGETVYCPADDVLPFSFGKAVFINVEKYEPAMMRDILLHEKAHVRGAHTLDLLLGEMVVIVGWFNPLAWMLRREVQLVIEYLADAEAIQQTHSVKDYQYHLLQTAQSNLALRMFGVHFNYKMLMRRVKKINQSDSLAIRRVLYIILVPMAILLLFVAHCSNTLYAYASDFTYNAVDGRPSVADVEVLPDTTALVNQSMPQFPGGDKALMQFLNENIIYPTKAKEDNVQGMVLVKFVVDVDGSIIDPHILRSVSPECDAEVMRSLSIMPRWSPAVEEGKVVKVDFVLPVAFKLQ